MDRGEAVSAAPCRVNRRKGFRAHGLGRNVGPSAAYTPKGCPPGAGAGGDRLQAARLRLGPRPLKSTSWMWKETLIFN